MYEQFCGICLQKQTLFADSPLLDGLSSSLAPAWCTDLCIFSILFCHKEKFCVCSPCAWLGGWLQRKRTPNIFMLKNSDSSLLLFSVSLRWVFLCNGDGVIQCLPSLHGEVPHLAHAGLLLVTQVAQLSLHYAGLSCQYANLLLLHVVLLYFTVVSY